MNSTGISIKTNTLKSGCQACRRKVVLKVDCKCKMILCFDCRYPEKHNCVFDYRTDAKELLKKNNPTITTEKLDRI